KGLSHKNADGLSRRTCESFGCEYCAKVERRSSESSKKEVARIVLEAENLKEWREEQRVDPSISIILRGKEAGVRPSRTEIAAEDVSAQVYWAYWDALVLKEGILYRKWEAPNLKSSFLQLIVPRRLVKGILEEMHNSPSGGHFGVEAFALRNMRAKTVAEIFVGQFVSRHGVPLEVHTDQGKNFELKLFAELMRLLDIRKTRTTALHPQSDGQVERQHQTITNYLAKYVSENQKDWDRWIPMFLLAYRSAKHETTGVSPAELYFARDLRLPSDLLRGSPSKSLGEEPPL
ncbi:uncharacterized protein LOC112466400, partial [Temnothorax curvispinosus]|uniref:Uncharacterized protein LOC112466400 n=1 Tax=Temnothorax curvispinosus TaxID=300111 RepID=A0A6J1RBE5_9HYME